MKYIVVSHKDEEQIFAFPKTIDHDRMMEAIGATRVGRGDHWEREYMEATPIAAGFIDNGFCHGKSESMGIDSRGEKDTGLLSLPTALEAAKGSWERNAMKYIVVSHQDKEQIFAFPKTIDHDRMMEAIRAVRMGRDNHWERVYRKATPIAAGFIDNGRCEGKSESLKLDSRAGKDTALLSLPAPMARASEPVEPAAAGPERLGAPKI